MTTVYSLYLPDVDLVWSHSHLRLLEAESIHIIREVAAESARPVMLYSIGKDSSVMLRLAEKAFHPGGRARQMEWIPRSRSSEADQALEVPHGTELEQLYQD